MTEAAEHTEYRAEYRAHTSRARLAREYDNLRVRLIVLNSDWYKDTRAINDVTRQLTDIQAAMRREGANVG